MSVYKAEFRSEMSQSRSFCFNCYDKIKDVSWLRNKAYLELEEYGAISDSDDWKGNAELTFLKCLESGEVYVDADNDFSNFDPVELVFAYKELLARKEYTFDKAKMLLGKYEKYFKTLGLRDEDLSPNAPICRMRVDLIDDGFEDGLIINGIVVSPARLYLYRWDSENETFYLFLHNRWVEADGIDFDFIDNIFKLNREV